MEEKDRNAINHSYRARWGVNLLGLGRGRGRDLDPLKEKAAWAINSAVRNPTRQSQTALSAHILDFSRKVKGKII